MEWKKLAIKGVDFVPRYGASCAISNDSIYIIGGGPDLSGQNQVLCYNTSEIFLFTSFFTIIKRTIGLNM